MSDISAGFSATRAPLRRRGTGLGFRSAFTLLLLALTTSTLHPDPVAGQSGAISAPAETAGTPAAVSQEPSGAPAEEEPLPRSMRPYWHVFLSFALTWVLIGGYVLSMGRRFARLEDELKTLRRLS